MPPLDLCLNRRLADFERRLENSGIGAPIKDATVYVGRWLRSRRGRPRRENPPKEWEQLDLWAKNWASSIATANEAVLAT